MSFNMDVIVPGTISIATSFTNPLVKKHTLFIKIWTNYTKNNSKVEGVAISLRNLYFKPVVKIEDAPFELTTTGPFIAVAYNGHKKLLINDKYEFFHFKRDFKYIYTTIWTTFCKLSNKDHCHEYKVYRNALKILRELNKN